MKKHIKKKFKAKDMGQLKFILGLNIERRSDRMMVINQKAYINKLIERFKLNNSKESDIPIQPNHGLTVELVGQNENLRVPVDETEFRRMIGSLIYLMISTRPDISYSVGVLSRFMQAPKELHLRYLKRLLRYVKTTIEYSLVYTTSDKVKKTLIGYTDSDYASDVTDRKSTSGYIFKYGDCTISWNSCKQKIVSLSSTEAEYIGLTNAAKEAIWYSQMLKELKKFCKKIEVFCDDIILYCDNKSTICLAKNPEYHSRSKHIDIRHHFIREKIEEGQLRIDYESTEEMCADMLTKGLPKIKHYKCMRLINLKN